MDSLGPRMALNTAGPSADGPEQAQDNQESISDTHRHATNNHTPEKNGFLRSDKGLPDNRLLG